MDSKKIYEKPEMRVVELSHSAALLQNSEPPGVIPVVIGGDE